MTLPLELLTPREIEVLRLVAQGLRDKQVGLALGISTFTARDYLASARMKLDLIGRSRIDVALFASRKGLLG